ncbi:MAG: DUF6942 family protein [Psychrobium sp.]
MTQIITNNLQQIIGLGNPTSKFCFNLPTAPVVGELGYDVAQIVDINGNHWRKIFVIIAKLCDDSDNWQQFRDQRLVSEVYLNFTTELGNASEVEYLCGKTHAETFELSKFNWRIVSDDYQVKTALNTKGQHLLLTPYLDYRQFPNALIAQIKDCLQAV